MPPQGRLGDKAFCAADAHGCPACAHPVIGPAVGGSPDVLVNHLPALRDGDPGVHAACCGPNAWNAKGGAPHVIINHRAAYRMGDGSSHCGGSGELIEGSPDVLVGDQGGSLFPDRTWIRVTVTDDEGIPLPIFDFNLDGCGHSSSGDMRTSSTVGAHDLDEGVVNVKLAQRSEGSGE